VLVSDEVVMDQPIPFYKPNKNVSEKVMDHPIPKTKHPHKVWSQKEERHLNKCPVAGNMCCQKFLMPCASYREGVSLCCKYIILIPQE
jgi:hypothetical protein